MTPEQTLDLALEALIHKANMIPVMQGNCYVIHPEAMQAVIDEAIKQALAAQPAPVQEAVEWPTVDEFAQHIRWINGSHKRGANSLAESLLEWLQVKTSCTTPSTAPTVQEPVDIDPLPRACNLAGVDYQTYIKIKSYMPVIPPAQPAPVPLTDEQIESLLPDDDTPMSLGEAFVKFARLVEAHHGITKGQP
jgi:hypothetical protein